MCLIFLISDLLLSARVNQEDKDSMFSQHVLDYNIKNLLLSACVGLEDQVKSARVSLEEQELTFSQHVLV